MINYIPISYGSSNKYYIHDIVENCLNLLDITTTVNLNYNL